MCVLRYSTYILTTDAIGIVTNKFLATHFLNLFASFYHSEFFLLRLCNRKYCDLAFSSRFDAIVFHTSILMCFFLSTTITNKYYLGLYFPFYKYNMAYVFFLNYIIKYVQKYLLKYFSQFFFLTL